MARKSSSSLIVGASMSPSRSPDADAGGVVKDAGAAVGCGSSTSAERCNVSGNNSRMSSAGITRSAISR
jgi:hypothetical protein